MRRSNHGNIDSYRHCRCSRLLHWQIEKVMEEKCAYRLEHFGMENEAICYLKSKKLNKPVKANCKCSRFKKGKLSILTGEVLHGSN